MPPPRGRDVCTVQDNSPAIVDLVHEEDALFNVPPPPPFHVIVPVKHEKRQKKDQWPVAASLPDDILIEILSRVCYKSLCRFKCVSRTWFALCSDLDINNRSPRTVTGFFGEYEGEAYNFHDLTGGGYPPLVDPTLAFLGSYERIDVHQCCGGALLLCRCWESRSEEDKYSYVVCNPVTEKWTVLPAIEFPEGEDGHLVEDRLFEIKQAEIFLGFDAINPSIFVVAVPMTNSFEQIREVAIYSSETGRWTSMQSQWRSETMSMHYGEAIFLNGRMHFTSIHSSILTVDVEGKVWREIELPSDIGLCHIGQSQGYLHCWHADDYQLSLWVLEEYGSANWTLKHSVNILELFRKNYPEDYEWYDIAIHPHCNLIFLTGWELTISYDMDNGKVQVICASKAFMRGVPYIPCFAKWSSDGH